MGTEMVRIRQSLIIVGWVSICVLLIPANVSAGGLFYPDVGTVALGRGSAFVARADTLGAFYYNPAGLSKSKGIHLLLGGNLNDLNVDFQRRGAAEEGEGLDGEWFPLDDRYFFDPDDPDNFLGVGNPQLDYSNGVEDPQDFGSVSQQTPLIINSVTAIASWGDAFAVEGLALALGLFAPSGYTKHRYDPDGPQRYAIRELNSTIIYPGFGISYAFNRYFQLGVVLLNGMAFLSKSQASRLVPTPGDTHYNEDAGGDASLSLEFKDMSMVTGIIGVLSHPVDWLEVGVSVKLPVTMEAEGTVDYTAPEDDYPDAVSVEGHNNVVVKQRFPWMVTTGLRYIHRLFDIELDFVWENWRSYESIDIELDLIIDLDDDPDTPDNEIPDTYVPKNFRDTYSIRLGSDINVLPEHLIVRLGWFYQSSAYPENNSTFSLDFPYGEQFGLTFGLTWHAFDFVDLNLAYAHIFQPTVTVTEGILQQSSGTRADILGDGSVMLPLGNTVNNGTYDVNLNIFSASVKAHF